MLKIFQTSDLKFLYSI
jgi:centriolar protein POC1